MIVPALLVELSGPLQVIVGFLLILSVYSGALLFTHWISKDE